MEKLQSIQWFPGHMAKTRRLIKESLPLVDIVVEIVDARIPISSRNPELDKWVANKPRIILLNKSDNADNFLTKQWCSYFKQKGILSLATDCKTGKGIKEFLPLVKETLSDILERRRNKGMVGRPLRIMIVGVPNVGKSSFINKMANSKRAKVEDRPGVTRGRQWITVSRDVEILDMPGVLWTKFEDQSVGEKLAFTGAIKDNVLDIELLAVRFLDILKQNYNDVLKTRYKIENFEDLDGYETLKLIGKKRGMLISGGEVDTERAAIMLFDEYRAGILGKLTFEIPKDLEKQTTEQD